MRLKDVDTPRKILNLRRKLGYSQYDCARFLRIDMESFAEIEEGKREPELIELQELIHLFKKDKKSRKENKYTRAYYLLFS